MDSHLVKLSKLLSLILRHKPQTIGLTLDKNGWAEVAQLIELANYQGIPLSPAVLEEIVLTNDKQRFSFNEDRTKIRANQGHSIPVDLELSPQQPPAQLFHGTAMRFLPSIQAQGLLPGNRQHVHLSGDRMTALKVGQRHGHPVVLEVQAGEMFQAGYPFFQAHNGVWLTAKVLPQFITFPEVHPPIKLQFRLPD